MLKNVYDGKGYCKNQYIMLDATYIAADKTTTRVHLNPRDASWTWSHVRDKSFRNRESHVDAHDGQFEIWKDESMMDIKRFLKNHLKIITVSRKGKTERF